MHIVEFILRIAKDEQCAIEYLHEKGIFQSNVQCIRKLNDAAVCERMIQEEIQRNINVVVGVALASFGQQNQ